MPLLIHAMAGPLAVHRQSVQLPRQTNGEVGDVDHLLHFAFALGQNLTRLQRDQPAEFVLVPPQLLADLAHDESALRRRQQAPPGGSLHSLDCSGLVVVGGTDGHAPERLAGGGIDRLNHWASHLNASVPIANSRPAARTRSPIRSTISRWNAGSCQRAKPCAALTRSACARVVAP